MQPPRRILPGGHKFNILLFGIDECLQATPRPKSDLANCLDITTAHNFEIILLTPQETAYILASTP